MKTTGNGASGSIFRIIVKVDSISASCVVDIGIVAFRSAKGMRAPNFRGAKGDYGPQGNQSMDGSEAELRKAAVLVVSLPQEEAAALMSKLTQKQIEIVSIEIAKLGRVPPDEQDTVINEFADMNPNRISSSTGNL